jgi:hypothetical protein
MREILSMPPNRQTVVNPPHRLNVQRLQTHLYQYSFSEFIPGHWAIWISGLESFAGIFLDIFGSLFIADQHFRLKFDWNNGR